MVKPVTAAELEACYARLRRRYAEADRALWIMTAELNEMRELVTRAREAERRETERKLRRRRTA
jgi:hypothetical protein